MGYHDDLAYSTPTVGWFFWNQLIAAGETEKWKTAMMGGEVRPELQDSCFTPGYGIGEYAQDVVECIETTHSSYLLNYMAFNKNGVGYTGVEREAAEQAALAMGYQLEVSGAELTVGSMRENVEATVNLTVSNTGIAPFYYDLTVGVSDLETKPLGESRPI